MSNGYAPIHAFLDAAAREFRSIADALAKASLMPPIIDAGNDRGRLLPVQVAACSRTVELDNLFGPAVQSAAASPLKDLLLPLLKRMDKMQQQLRSKAIQAEDDETDLPGAFVERYLSAIAELLRFIGPSPSTGNAQRDEKNGGKRKRRRGGKRRLEDSNPLKFQVYQRIQKEHQPGGQHLDTIERLKRDKDCLEQAQDAGVKLNRALVKDALAFFDRRKRLSASVNQ